MDNGATIGEINDTERANRAVSEWNVPPGTLSAPIAKLKYRLSLPLYWYRVSIVQTVVEEIGRFPRRIREYLQEPYLRRGFPINKLDPSGYSSDGWREESIFQRFCMSDMQRLRQENRWAGYLDLRMAAEAYRLGAAWAIRNMRNESKNEGS